MEKYTPNIIQSNRRIIISKRVQEIAQRRRIHENCEMSHLPISLSELTKISPFIQMKREGLDFKSHRNKSLNQKDLIKQKIKNRIKGEIDSIIERNILVFKQERASKIESKDQTLVSVQGKSMKPKKSCIAISRPVLKPPIQFIRRYVKSSLNHRQSFSTNVRKSIPSIAISQNSLVRIRCSSKRRGTVGEESKKMQAIEPWVINQFCPQDEQF